MNSARVLFSALFLVASPLSAIAGPADDLSAAIIRDLGAANLTGSAVGTARDAGSDLVLANVTFTSAGARAVTVKIATVTVTGAAPNGVAQKARVVLEGLEATDSSGPVNKAPRVEASSVDGPVAALLATFVSPDPFLAIGSDANLAALTAPSIVIPTMETTRQTAGQARTATWRDTRIEGLAGGKITTMTIAAITTTRGTGDKAEIGRVAISGYDLKAATTNDNATRTLMDGMTIAGMSGSSARGAPFKIETIAIGRMALKPGQKPVAELFESLSAMPRGPLAGIDDQRRAAGVFADLFSRFDIERVEFRKLSGESASGKPIAFDTFALRGIADGKITAIELSGISNIDDTGRNTTIGRMVMEGLDVSGAIDLAREFSAGRYSQGDAFPQRAYPEFRRFALEGTVVKDAAGMSLGELGLFALENGPRIGIVPTRIRARIADFVAPIADAKMAAQLGPIGITDKIKLNADAELEYVESARELRIGGINVALAEAGSLRLTATIGGIERSALEALPRNPEAITTAARAGPLALRYTEEGAVAALIAKLAEDQDVEEDEIVTQLKAQFGAILSQMVPDKGMAARFTRTIGEFLEDPHSLNLSIRPKGDIPFAALGLMMAASPGSIFGLFDVTIEANK
ncbi:MAG: hypothetical protein WCH83_02545 [Alphaproteobacteria bacterium]